MSILDRLLEGNRRFLAGRSAAPNRDEERRLQTLKGQNPFATIVTCSDSRLSPNLFFDTGIGDLFVIRTAGNVLGEIDLGSIEYSVEHLNVGLVMVMGHTNCGAVTAFVNGAVEHNHIQAILDSLKNEPEEAAAIKEPEKVRLNKCIIANTEHQVKFMLKNSDIIAHKVKEGKLQLVEAIYDHQTGLVKVIHTVPEVNKKTQFVKH
ncbi:MAG: carbonic anhydrase [Thermonemataceae bacterium]|nr:carbonic anhydrase [Thermonemataceae bacterium]